MLQYIESLRIAAHAATIAHADQTRKNGRTPYIVHPASVAQMVLMYDQTNYLGAIVAWYHDVLEDCGVDGAVIFVDSLNNMLLSASEKSQIELAVDVLTKDDRVSPRNAKWDDCLHRLLAVDAPHVALLVKICDRIDNLMDMDGFSPEFRKLYIEETDQMIRAIERRLLTNPEQAAFNDLKELRNEIVSTSASRQ